MKIEYKEIYAKDKEDLSELVQQWIDEDVLNICCKSGSSELEYRQDR